MQLLLIILIVLLLIGGLGVAPGIGWWGGHSYGWGAPGGLGLVLLIVVLILIFGR